MTDNNANTFAPEDLTYLDTLRITIFPVYLILCS